MHVRAALAALQGQSAGCPDAQMLKGQEDTWQWQAQQNLQNQNFQLHVLGTGPHSCFAGALQMAQIIKAVPGGLKA